LDNAGTVTFAASPTTQASALVPTTPNASPRTTDVQSGTNVTLTATPKLGYAFVRWTGLPGTAAVTGNVARFEMPTESVDATAEFATSSSVFAGAGGAGNSFYGLLLPQGQTAAGNATVGFLTGTLTSTTGAFSGRVLVDGVNQAFSATFYGNGDAVFTTGTTRSNSLTFGGRTLTLSLNTAGAKDQIAATLTSGGNTSTGTAKRAIYSSSNKFAHPGTYTIAFPAKTQNPAIAQTSFPQGVGYGTLTLSDTGMATLSGTLADDTSFTGSTALVAGDEIPFLAQLHTPGSTSLRGGCFNGTLVFDTAQLDTDLTGTDLLWIRPSVTQGSTVATRLYTGGWPTGIQVDAVGARYNPALTVQIGLGLGPINSTAGNGNLAFAADKLTSQVIITKFNVNGSVVTKIPANNTTFSLAVTQSSGAFSGTFTPNWTSPAASRPAFKGIILQKGDNRGGYGFFLSNRVNDNDPESGIVILSNQP
jgi:hypothetical protein